MSKVVKVLVFVGLLWLLSFVVASVFFGESSTSISAGNQIAVIPISGAITLGGSSSLFSSTSSGESIVEKIEQADANDNVKGIVLSINSPGGTVMGSKVVVDAIKEVDKPVVAVITEYGASGAYWIASQADYIYADDLSIVGSIGVLGSYLEFGGLLEDYNVSYQRLVTGEFKDISTPYREMTEEEEALIMVRLQGIHDYFVADVADGRGMTVQEIEELANGLFYLGYNSVDNGLVDATGNQDDAVAKVEELAGITGGTVEEYVEDDGWWTAIKEYTSYSSYYIGQGIGSVMLEVEGSAFLPRV